MSDTLTLDPNDPFEKQLIDIVATNRRKRKDYAGDGDPFRNFKDTAIQVNGSPGLSVEVLLATKASRLKTLLFTGASAVNESVEDTILDRAVYSIIALAMYRQGLYRDDWDQPNAVSVGIVDRVAQVYGTPTRCAEYPS